MRTAIVKPLLAGGLLFLVGAGLWGCPQQGDIGLPCRMVKSDGDGGTVSILVSEVDTTQDVISLGALECENLICIHARNTPVSDAGPTAELTGTCSETCGSTDPNACSGLYDRSLLGQYSCRGLILDAETLRNLCEVPEPSTEWLCSNAQASFCAQGSADAGL